MIFSQDVVDLLTELAAADVQYVIVGGHALAFHGITRSTLDFDLFIFANKQNSLKLMKALASFGAPVKAHGVSEEDFQREGTVYQMGLPPNRIDILTRIDGVSFSEAWQNKVSIEIDGITIHFLSLRDIIKNKSSTSRAKDIADLELLRKIYPG